MSVAVFGLPHTGTSIVWDVLCHDPSHKRWLYEPLRQSVMDGHASLWRCEPEALEEVEHHYHPSMEFAPLILRRGDECSSLRRYLRGVLGDPTESTCVKFIQMMTRLDWFLWDFEEFTPLVVVRDPRGFAFSMKPNSSRWTDPARYAWYDRSLWAAMTHPETHAQFYPVLAENDYVKLLTIWGVAVAEATESGVPIMRLEDFAVNPRAALSRALGTRGVPSGVGARIDGVSCNAGAQERKWSGPVSAEAVSGYELIPSSLWSCYIETAGIRGVMADVGYA